MRSNKKSAQLRRFIIAGGLLISAGCEQPAVVRTYEEITTEAPVALASTVPGISEIMGKAMPEDDIHAALNLPQTPPNNSDAPVRWQTPAAWQEKPASGMRLASFVNRGADQPIDCSIVFLGGSAGSVEENIVRWLKQLNLPVPESAELTAFIKQQKKIKLNAAAAVLIDFSVLQNDPQASSMTAAIVELPTGKIFIKMTGTKNAVAGQQSSFLELVQSLTLNP